jgi:Arc/MetJ-type ribon-helix-helix transcriptional regulator
MAVPMGNKFKIGVTISPYLKERADQLLEENKFSSMSDLMSVALAKFLGDYDREQKEREKERECNKSVQSSSDASYLQTKEGKALIKSVIMEAFTPQKENNAPVKKKPIAVHTEEYLVDDIIGRELK